MTVAIAGMGWVTPLGAGIDQVWERLLAGDTPESEQVEDPISAKTYPVYRVPASALNSLPVHARLRRASAISRFAAAAGLAALQNANVTPDAGRSDRIALIFGVANGGVIYTKRFYRDIVNTGADAASPLLFPETVFNAAASHLAAIIGLTGATYTLVADGTVGLSAIEMGSDLIANGEVDYCLIVTAEEADWLLCDAYRKWRLLRDGPPVEVFAQSTKGTILSEGAGAIVLGRTGDVEVEAIAAGAHFDHRRSAPAILADVLKQVSAAGSLVICSANGTFIDSAEARAVTDVLGNAELYSPKPALGEGVAASALWQIIVAVQALRTGKLPMAQKRLGNPQSNSVAESGTAQIVVLSCGLNQHVGATRLVKRC